ncbi:MAG: RNA-binding protein [Chloroflexi bacterium]|nr:RNA-binding protein [Chloroflexota bacterium]
MRIYVGNLAYDVTEDELRQEFAAHGKVESVSMITERDSGRPKGFAFVEMPSASEGQAAIAALNGKTLKDRQIVVNVAREREERGVGGGGNRGGFGGRGGGFAGRGKGRRY